MTFIQHGQKIARLTGIIKYTYIKPDYKHDELRCPQNKPKQKTKTKTNNNNKIGLQVSL